MSRSYPDTLRYVVSRRSGRAPSLRALTRKMGGEVVLPLTPSGARRSREWPAPHFAPALAHLERVSLAVLIGISPGPASGVPVNTQPGPQAYAPHFLLPIDRPLRLCKFRSIFAHRVRCYAKCAAVASVASIFARASVSFPHPVRVRSSCTLATPPSHYGAFFRVRASASARDRRGARSKKKTK